MLKISLFISFFTLSLFNQAQAEVAPFILRSSFQKSNGLLESFQRIQGASDPTQDPSDELIDRNKLEEKIEDWMKKEGIGTAHAPLKGTDILKHVGVAGVELGLLYLIWRDGGKILEEKIARISGELSKIEATILSTKTPEMVNDEISNLRLQKIGLEAQIASIDAALGAIASVGTDAGAEALIKTTGACEERAKQVSTLSALRQKMEALEVKLSFLDPKSPNLISTESRKAVLDSLGAENDKLDAKLEILQAKLTLRYARNLSGFLKVVGRAMVKSLISIPIIHDLSSKTIEMFHSHTNPSLFVPYEQIQEYYRRPVLDPDLNNALEKYLRDNTPSRPRNDGSNER